MIPDPLILGTRGSALALWQAEYVRSVLADREMRVQIREIKTKGDRILDVPLSQIGDKGLFTRELDDALLDGRIHLAVHSLKDLPTRLPPGIILAAVSPREDPHDAFVAHPSFSGSLVDLPDGAVLATSSLRRQAQLLAWRPDVRITSVRGNVGTRLAKLDAGDWHGLILAAAGLKRLGLAQRIRNLVPEEIMLSAVGQGALGIVCAASQEPTHRLLHDALNDPAASTATDAERAFLRRLEGGCQAPVGAYAQVRGDRLFLSGCVAATDGSVLIRGSWSGPVDRPESIGRDLAERLLGQGAGEVLRRIRSQTGG